MALQEETASQSDVVGQADAPAASGVMSLFQRATASSQDRADVFALGDRAALLHHLDQAAIIPHVADSEGRKYPFEVRFGLHQGAEMLQGVPVLPGIESIPSKRLMAATAS